MTANDNDHRGLLPAGLADLLPPDAAREARAIDIAIERFAAFGYERVKPPLVEFEESLLVGPGAGVADLPADGPGLAAHDGRAAGHDGAGRPHRRDSAEARAAAAQALLRWQRDSRARQRAEARAPIRPGRHRADRRRFAGGR